MNVIQLEALYFYVPMFCNNNVADVRNSEVEATQSGGLKCVLIGLRKTSSFCKSFSFFFGSL